MAKNQKYYYMRLRADFFSRKDIILLENMPNGAVYCLILLKLLTASLENNGHLMLNEEIVMTPAMLATITRYDVGTVEKALQIFMQLGLVEQLPDNSYYMLELEGMVGKTSTEADRKRIARANVKALKGEAADKCPPNVQVLSKKSPPEIEIEKETDIKTEIDSDREIYGRYKNVSLTPSEYESLKNEFPIYADKYIERLSEYMETKGKSYSNHYATILSWLKQDIKSTNYSCKEGESL